jgi:hypothetical protein
LHHAGIRPEPGQKLKEKPGDYIQYSSALSHLAKYDTNFHEHKAIVREWWLKNRDNIKAEFDKNLEHIQDPSIKRHIQQNFNDRHELVNKWAEDPEFYQKHSLFESGLKVKNTEIVPRQPTSKPDKMKAMPQQATEKL